MSDLLKKLRKNSNIKETNILADSTLFNDIESIPTSVPALNIALSGKIDGGLTPGFTMFAGPSKHYKTSFALVLARAYLKHHEDAILIFYDSEFGSPKEYFESFGIDPSRVLHIPITNVEDLKFDIMKQLESIEREDNVIILIDSLGNLASKKEVEDSLNEKAVADMTRAKQLKSLFRMVTPYLKMRSIPLIGINHTYKEIGLYPKDIVGGGCVVAGTQIQRVDENGNVQLTNIEDIVKGDIVKTLTGQSVVTHTWNPETLTEGTPECYEVEFEDGTTCICSDEHMFKKGDEWVLVTDLSEGDIVVSSDTVLSPA